MNTSTSFSISAIPLTGPFWKKNCLPAVSQLDEELSFYDVYKAIQELKTTRVQVHTPSLLKCINMELIFSRANYASSSLPSGLHRKSLEIGKTSPLSPCIKRKPISLPALRIKVSHWSVAGKILARIILFRPATYIAENLLQKFFKEQ